MIADRLAEHVKNCAVDKLADHFAQVRHCALLLTDEQLWYRPNQSSNPIGMTHPWSAWMPDRRVRA